MRRALFGTVLCSPGESGGGGGGGYSSEFLVGVCRPVLQILTLFQTKTCHFFHPFTDLGLTRNIYVYIGLNYVTIG